MLFARFGFLTCYLYHILCLLSILVLCLAFSSHQFLIPFQELSGRLADLTNDIDRSREEIKHLEKSCSEQLNELQTCRSDSDNIKTSNDVR